ncbi:hypothetical protein [Zhongshania borealis]|uniref:Uncharacterized protein n=1 Tax=Zhongshania borealis TaxID=889488 RepID=A0ABP7WE89_9GAMM
MTKKVCVVIGSGPSSHEVQRVAAALAEHCIAINEKEGSARELEITPHPPVDIEYVSPRIISPAYGPKKKRGKGNRYHRTLEL